MANGAGIQYLGDDGSDGVVLGRDSSATVGVYGTTPVAQASDIVAVTGTVSLTTTINALLTVIRNFGLMA